MFSDAFVTVMPAPETGNPPSLDTIAAVATAVAPGQGGIAVIRLSGPQAQQAVQAVTRFPGQQEWASHRVLYGHVLALSLIHISEPTRPY